MSKIFELQKIGGVTLATHAVTRAAGLPAVVEDLKVLAQLLAQVERVEVTTQEQYARAGDLLKLLKSTGKRLDELRKKEVGPVSRAVRAVNAFFKEAAADPVATAEKNIKTKMAHWARAEEDRRREAAARAAEELERAALETAAKLEEMGQEQAAETILDEGVSTSQAEKDSAKLGPARGQYGATTSTKHVWKFEVIDISQVPREYMMVDERAVAAAIAEGVREIKGLKIFEGIQIAIR